jgi:hypothetical protein
VPTENNRRVRPLRRPKPAGAAAPPHGFRGREIIIDDHGRSGRLQEAHEQLLKIRFAGCNQYFFNAVDIIDHGDDMQRIDWREDRKFLLFLASDLQKWHSTVALLINFLYDFVQHKIPLRNNAFLNSLATARNSPLYGVQVNSTFKHSLSPINRHQRSRTDRLAILQYNWASANTS